MPAVGSDGLVFVGLDVFQPGLVQHVIDVVGMADRDETPARATESGDVAATGPAQETVARVESDGDAPRASSSRCSAVWPVLREGARR